MKRAKKVVPTRTPRKESNPLSKALSKLGLTDVEAIDTLKSLKRGRKRIDSSKITISGDSFCFGYFSDAHIGSSMFQPELFAYMVKFFQEQKPDFILNAGDHLEGMSGRPGHVYELSQIGLSQQLKYAVELYSQLDNFDHYGIDGNHDQWYFKKNDNGVVVGEELAKSLKKYHHLGQDEGNMEINGIRIRLVHAGDGTAYADSYKLQRRIDSLSGGVKPHIILSGHYHKELYIFRRGVHGLECGTLCGQTVFMKGKNISAHMGFGFVRVFFNHRGVERFIHEFVPWYEV